MEESGFVYETLGFLSVPASASPSKSASDDDDYAVFRNRISTSAPASTKIAAVDYFSLDVCDSAEDPVPDGESGGPPPPPTSEDPRVAEAKAKQAAELKWFRAGCRFRSPMLQLHQEILDFCNFVSPTPEEQASRTAAVQRVFEVIKYIWPHCKAEVFGSFSTGLYLPTSDIDAVILNSNVTTIQMGLRALSKALSQRSIAKKIQVIGKARVPIIKFIERQSGLAFDISFDVHNGPKAADFIKDAVARMPPLRPLCLILKVFLQQRELNEVYSGGIGSYALLTMLIVHLQVHWRGQDLRRQQMSLEHNLGVLLVSFFELYGRKLNSLDVGISCRAAGAFFLKSHRGFLNMERPHLLSIEDPQAPENDIGRSSFNYFQVRSAFASAYSMLTDARTIVDLGAQRSILGTIIRPDPVLLDRKGGCNGEMTFDSLLPGAGEPVQRQSKDEMLCNWFTNNDDSFPRETVMAGDENTPTTSRSKRRDKYTQGSEETFRIRRQENGSREKRRKKGHWDGDGGFDGGRPHRRSDSQHGIKVID
ncbi:hypothetical protein QJS04_geneDACA022473 [Acorus gramineus]|uniref:polynucleotide adenylyltransferase n=1 Tax=Acorus gramineus TaxID=55184 RepID=A0AAV9BGV6_ACOGR|nr:hypothetical protein QJS04_geneDACA022473 [Acorus gramineus]